MLVQNHMHTALAASITRSASPQTYLIIRLLVTPARQPDAFRSYAYFRWLDDQLDTDGLPADERLALIDREQALLDACSRRAPVQVMNENEEMLVELLQAGNRQDSGLRAYLHSLMRVMRFDTARRGRLISQAELAAYTQWLAVAVTENLHHFLCPSMPAPRAAGRYMAVSAAHITHMLRDTFADIEAGYFNIPREALQAGRIAACDVHSDAYRGWVRERVLLARQQFKAGRRYLMSCRSLRLRAAVCSYAARFEAVLAAIEADGFRLREHYAVSAGLRGVLRMGWAALASTLWPASPSPREALSPPDLP